MIRKPHYSQFDKQRFWECLEHYRKALATGTKEDIINASLNIHIASGRVPNSYRRFITRTFKETKREVAL